MYEPVKVCPECGTYCAPADAKCRSGSCAYLFVGGELGSVTDPVRIATVDATLPDDAIAERQHAAVSASATQSTRREDVRLFAIGLLWFLGIVAIGVIFFAFAMSFKPGPTGERGLGAMIVASAGVLAILSAVVNLVRSVWRLLFPPRYTSATQLARVFYNELLGFGGGGTTRAWNCLDARAQNELGSVDQLRAHFKHGKEDADAWGLANVGMVPSRRPANYAGKPEALVFPQAIEVHPRSDTVADVTCDLYIDVSESVEVRKSISGTPITGNVYHARFIWPQKKTALKVGDRWYLTSGTLDRPIAAGAG